MNRLLISDTPFSGLKRIQRQRLGDDRGFLSRLFCAQELEAVGWEKPLAQINHTHTARRGTVRGMHLQLPPHAEMKLVACLRGEIWDVVVDLRRNSATYLQWHAERLASDNDCALLIPEGFAHGFQALSDDVELLYCHSAAFAPEAECGLHVSDQRIGIAWPLPVQGLSARDASHPGIEELRKIIAEASL